MIYEKKGKKREEERKGEGIEEGSVGHRREE